MQMEIHTAGTTSAAPMAPHEVELADGDPRTCLQAVTAGRDLSAGQAEALFGRILAGRVSPVLIGALLAALRTKGESAAEIAAAARVMRAHAARVFTTRRPLVDTCGTGGDFSGTFNVSTAAAFVVAAAGIAVAKHGNRAASSRCGSADVLEAAGVVIDLDPGAVGRVLDRVGIGFLFAPNFHPATRHATAARREIGIRTLFNLLGPLTNPAGAERQVIGVPAPELVETMAAVLVDLESEYALVVHGSGGLDEVSVSGTSRVATIYSGTVEIAELSPGDLGLASFPLADLAGGDAPASARILRAVLEGRGTEAQSAFVAANAGAGILVGGGASTLRAGADRAREILAAGSSAEILDQLIEASREESRGE